LSTEVFMQEHDEAGRYDYPLGRGYGHDYMRGGEVLGGYGYSEREEYERPRGETGNGVAPAEAASGSAPASAPRDEFAGGGTEPPLIPTDETPQVKPLRHVYGSTGQRYHSRSFYVTQAQVMGRLYGPHRYSPGEQGPYQQRVTTRRYDDAELRRSVEEAIFHDTWVDSDSIAVEVERGVVTLSGTLRTYEEVRYACDDAWDVPGVRGVRCELKVEE
jgi:hypothetical protein